MKRGIIFGCFDLFHIGHFNVIQAAMNRCNHLTIGLFTDEAIVNYKRRPFVPYQYRKELLEAIFPEATVIPIKKRAIRNCDMYDIIFVSDKLRGHKLSMVEDRFEGILYYLPYTEGISTTKILMGEING